MLYLFIFPSKIPALTPPKQAPSAEIPQHIKLMILFVNLNFNNFKQ